MSRHPSVESLMQFFSTEHLPEGVGKTVANHCAGTAEIMLHQLSDNPELTAGLRKLLEAKDCFVRASLDQVSASYTDR